MQQDFSVSYKNHCFQLAKQQQTIVRAKEMISVHNHLDGSFSLWIRKVRLAFTILPPRKSRRQSAVDYVNHTREVTLVAPNSLSLTQEGGGAKLHSST